MHLANWGTLQVMVDLFIAAFIGILWMVRDARQNGRTVWPYVLGTLVAGSFGLLAYLLLGGQRQAASPKASVPGSPLTY
jgi:hypothetical protein